MTFNRKHAARALAALFVAAMPAMALARQMVTTEYAEQPYTLAPACETGKPVLFINVHLNNDGNTPSGPVKLTAADGTHELAGDATLAQLPAGDESIATVPMYRVGDRKSVV